MGVGVHACVWGVCMRVFMRVCGWVWVCVHACEGGVCACGWVGVRVHARVWVWGVHVSVRGCACVRVEGACDCIIPLLWTSALL